MKSIIIIAIAVVFLFAPSEINALTTDKEYKDAVYPLKSSYYDLVSDIENQIKLSEKALSGLNFESSEAKKKIDTAWKIRWMAWESHGEIGSVLKQIEYSLDNRQYQDSYNNLLQIDQYLYSIKNDLYAIKKEIKNAQILEEQYQQDKRFCFLWWCSEAKNTYGLLDPKIQNIESNLDELENKLENFEKEKTSISASIEQKIVIKNKNQEIQQLENLRKQEKYEADRQEQLRIQQQYEAEQERQRLKQQNLRDAEKNQIRLKAKDYPLIRGWMYGELTFWVEPLPAYTSQNVRENVENLASWMDGSYMNGVKLKRTYSENTADFTINWVTDYNPEHIGRQVGDHLLVGLGSSNCGSWSPFNGITVYRVMYHEVGHAMGQDHSNDYNNIMYDGGADTKYEYDYKDTITLSDGYWQSFNFCHGGSVYFTTEKAYDYSASYEVYVIRPSTDASDFIFRSDGDDIPTCSGDYNQSYNSFSRSCNVPNGAKIVLYNPSSFGTGSDARIKIEIRDTHEQKDVDYSFKSDSRYFSDDYLYRVQELFR